MAERDWIHHYIRPLVKAEGADFLRDDVAVLSSGAAAIVTMDTLVEGRHFLAGDPLDTVGQKLVRVNVSDIFAKGAAPREALLSIAWPEGRGEADFAALMAGIGADLQAFAIDLIGGDFVSTPGPLVLSLTLTGACFGAGPVRRMARAPVGSSLWVSGEIGAAYLGFEAIKSGGSAGRIVRYRVPRLPRVQEAQLVAARALAAMDVSDGLLRDALTLGEGNGRGVEINLGQVPVADPSADVERLLAQMTWGDDYQILMVLPPDAAPGDKGQAAAPAGFTRIGRLIETPGLRLLHRGQTVNAPLTLGFEH